MQHLGSGLRQEQWLKKETLVNGHSNVMGGWIWVLNQVQWRDDKA